MEIIRTERLILRPWREDDLESLIQAADNPKIWEGLRESFPNPYTETEARWWLKHFADYPARENRALEFAGRAIGGVALHRLEDVYQKTAEVGYWLGEPYWGKGIATEALGALTRHAWDQTDFVRLQGGVFGGNRASMRVMEKSGYHLEAVHRRAIFKDGKILDEFLYVRLRPQP